MNSYTAPPKRLEIWDKRRAVLVEEDELLRATKLFIEALKGTEFAPSELAEGKFLKAYFGRLSNENYQRLTDSAEESPIYNKRTYIRKRQHVDFGYDSPRIFRVDKTSEAVYFKEFSLKEISEQLVGEDPLSLVRSELQITKEQ